MSSTPVTIGTRLRKAWKRPNDRSHARGLPRRMHSLILRFLCCFPVPDWLGFQRNKPVGMFLFLLAQIGDHCAKIETESLGVRMPDSADFINNWVVLHGYSSMSSSGVQITGQA